MSNYQRNFRKLWTLGGTSLGTTIAASGDSTAGATIAPIDISNVCDLALSVKTGTPGGTAPTLLVQVDMQDPDGNWLVQAMKTASINAAGVAVVYGGLHISAANFVPLGAARVAWTIGGTAGPNWPNTTIDLMGR